METNLLAWLGFSGAVIFMLILDLGVFHRKPRPVSQKEALIWTGVWFFLALLFNALIFWTRGYQSGIEFFTGYLVEKSLSLDNVFIFALIFTHFATPLKYQHRILLYGVLSAIILRGIFIYLGVELIRHFEWIFYIFGAILVITAIKMVWSDSKQSDLTDNKVLKFVRRYVPLTDEYHREKFVVRIKGKWRATPLLVILIFIEISDIIFAVDSIPAIFAITQDPFIIYTSNIFAILGLRSLYFLLANSLQKFHYLHYGLAFILMFIGIKLLIVQYIHIPLWVSLGVITVSLLVSITVSLVRKRGPSTI